VATLTSVAPSVEPMSSDALAATLEALGWSPDVLGDAPPYVGFAGNYHPVLAVSSQQVLAGNHPLKGTAEAMRVLLTGSAGLIGDQPEAVAGHDVCSGRDGTHQRLPASSGQHFRTHRDPRTRIVRLSAACGTHSLPLLWLRRL
jgi:hypothetical protein